ncbi:MAG: hypothetical protein FD128_2240, partial [Hyphomonadaceae bacterium]
MIPDFLNLFANAPGQLLVEGVAAGSEALFMARGMALRGGIGVFVASDDASAQKFATSINFFDPNIEIL